MIADVHTDAIATSWKDGDPVLGSRADTPATGTRYDADTMRSHVSDRTGQLFDLPSLREHYHQNDAVDLRLAVDPALAEGDAVAWEWRWPGSETWQAFPAMTGLGKQINAEQALSGVQVRATLTFADDNLAPVVAGPVTIDVDDHGAAARQVPTVGGPTNYTAGESLALAIDLPDNGPTILADHRWERRAAGTGEWVTVEGQSGSELARPATRADDGASYRVSVLKPDGTVAYGPSEPVTVTVVDETATELAIAGVESSYDVGDVLRARVVGHTLSEGQSWRWIIRPAGSTGGGYVFHGDGSQDEVTRGRLRQLLDVQHHGYEIRARLRQGSAAVPGRDTGWVTVRVDNAVAPTSTTFPTGTQYLGADIVFPLTGPALGPDESLRLVYRGGSPWFALPGATRVGDTVVARPPFETGASEFAVQTIRNGVVTAMSEPVAGEVKAREVLVQGIRGVYRVGQTLRATAEIHPAAEGLTYRWYTLDGWDHVVLKEGTGTDALSIELPMTMDWHDQPLHFAAVADAAVDDPLYGDEIWAGQWGTTVKVSDAALETQLLFFENLGEHYHQGYDIDLNLVADPELDPGDTLHWEWKWPGVGWEPFPGPAGLSHRLIAEQALDGVQVRATLKHADSADQLVSDPVTIHHDDHGGAARQVPAVRGATSFVEGERVTLTRVLPDNGPTVLTEHRWERRAAGSEVWTTVEGRTASLSSTAATADDGASYRVSILKPNGDVAYGPSEPHTLAVTAAVPGPVSATVSVAAIRQVYGRSARLDVRVSSGATGRVEVDLPGRTVAATLVGGSASIALPARSVGPGRHALRVRYAGVAGRFEPATGVARLAVVRAAAKVRVTPAKRRVERGRSATLRIAVTAPGASPRGTVVVRVAGRTRAVRLDRGGRAVVRIRLAPRSRIGTRPVTVTYRGDRFVGRATAQARIRVTR